MKYLYAIALIGYILIAIIQLAAIQEGLNVMLGFPDLLALFVSLIVAFIPVIGSVLGVWGATHGFGWSVMGSILLFFWPYVLVIPYMLYQSVTE